MKLLVLAPRFPYPLEKGDKLRLYHQLKHLSHQHQICLVCLSHTEIPSSDYNKIQDITDELHVLTITKQRRRLGAAKAFFGRIPLQLGYYYNAATQKKIKEIAKAFDPDHVYCQLIRMAPYAAGLPYSKTLDYMDAFGVGMKRRANVAKGILKSIYNLEYRRIRKYEVGVYSKFNGHTIISEQDRKQIGEGDQDITIVPNGIDTSHFQPMESVQDHDIGFIGNMGYPPNVEAAEYLINNLQLSDRYRVLLAGARPDKRVQVLASENTTVTGWVDDVRKEYARCKIFVAPLWSGTGQQNKILEAMAMGIPCVTTTTVNNAIGATPDKEILLADDEKQFQHQINRLLTDDTLFLTLKKEGLQFVSSRYSWSSSVDVLESILNK